MEVAGLCTVCGRPGALATCKLCGALGHPRCLDSPAHMHGGRRGPDPAREWGSPKS